MLDRGVQLDKEAFLFHLSRLWARARRYRSWKIAVMAVQFPPEVEATEWVDAVRSAVRQEDLVASVDGLLWLALADLRGSSDPLRVAQRLQAFLPALTKFSVVYGFRPELELPAVVMAAELTLKRATSYKLVAYSEPELQDRAEARLLFEGELRRAVRQGELDPFYQPIVDLKTGRINGFEALVRWDHPTSGWLLPGQFLSVARDCGLMIELDLFVLGRAFEQLRLWREKVEYPIRVNVNLSSEHFLEPEGVDRLRPILDHYADCRSQLRVDVREKVLSHSIGLESLRELSSMSVGFHMDDFGAGMESFQALTHFAFESLKIDRSLIAEMEEEVNAELVTAILRIAARMNLRTIAEGLATHAQLEELRTLGCQEAQGFLFSPAIDADAALNLLREGRRW